MVCAALPVAAPPELKAALEAQSRPPGESVEGGSPREALAAAMGSGAEWIWQLDASVVPEPPALERLLEALDRLGPLPAPALLASKVVSEDGSLDPSSLPVPDVRDVDHAVAAFGQRVLVVRVARSGSLLIRRSALERHSPRREPDMEWTARLLKHELGLLVPASVVVRRSTAARPEAAGLVRLLVSDALEPAEKPWFALRLAEVAAGAARRAARGARPRRSRHWGSDGGSPGSTR